MATVAQVSLSWADVAVNVDGTPLLDLDHYEVYERPFGSDPTAAKQRAITTENNIDLSPYTSGTMWWFKVRAVDTSGNRGAFSLEKSVTMASDTIPPQAPSAPVVTSSLGVLYVTWNGLPASGSWPPDFLYVEVHTSTTDNFTPTSATYVDHLYAAGQTVLPDTSYGIPQYVRLVAVDAAGLKSVPSAVAVGTPHRLVGSDIDPGAITYEQIGFKDPGNLILDGSFESDPFRTEVSSRSASAWTFTNTAAFHGTYSAFIDAQSQSGTSRRLVLMDTGDEQTIKPTEKLFCRYAYKSSTLTNGALQLVATWVISDGSTTTTVLTAPPIAGGAWQQVGVQMTAPANTVSVRLNMELTAAATLGTWWVDAVEVRRTVNTSIIEDAAITNALIANLAVNDAKIANLSVGKLTAGTLSATVLVGGTIRTATSGQRIELTGGGLRFFRADGTISSEMMVGQAQLRCYSTGDVSLTSTQHAFQIGNTAGINTIFDGNEIMARNNGQRGTLALNLEGGDVHLSGIIKTRQFDATHGGVVSDVADTGVQFLSTEVQVINGGGSAYRAIRASAFNVGSSADVKINRAGFDPFPIMASAPSERWQYRPGFADDGWHYGPMADDLPDIRSGTGEDASLDLGALTGVLWEAVRRLSSRVEELERGDQ